MDGEVGNFHALTRHLCVKGLFEGGIDDVIANLGCVEATLMVRRGRGRTDIEHRVRHLGADEQAIVVIKKTYKMRDNYLHSPGIDNQYTFVAIPERDPGRRYEDRGRLS